MLKSKDKIALSIGLCLILLIAVITFFRPQLVKKETKIITNPQKEVFKYPQLSAQEVQEKINKKEKIIILDVRSRDEFQIEHIIDSINIPLADLSQNDNILGDGAIIIIGRDDSEYAQAVKTLENKNHSKVYALTGGIYAWKKNNGQTISLGDPTSFVDKSKVNFVTPEDLKGVLDKNYAVYILDIRDQKSFSEGHLKGAVNIPSAELEKRRNELPATEEMVVYGETEMPAFQAGVTLYGLNFYTVNVLKGGISLWREKGFEVVK